MKHILSILQLSLLIFTSVAGAEPYTQTNKAGAWQETQKKLSLAAASTTESATNQRDTDPDEATATGALVADQVPATIETKATSASPVNTLTLELPHIRGPPLSLS